MKKLFAILLIAFFSIHTNVYASYKDALKLYQEKKYNEALKIIASELVAAKDMEANAPNYKQRYLAAHIHWKLGNHQNAAAHFKRCLDIKKDAVEPLIDMSLLYLDAKKYGDARFAAKASLAKKENAIAYYVIGETFRVNKQYGDAKYNYEKSVSIDPELAVAYNALGLTLMKMNKYGEANTAFSAALAVYPNSSEILNNAGKSFEMLGKKDEALKYYKQAEKINPNNYSVKKNIERLTAVK